MLGRCSIASALLLTISAATPSNFQAFTIGQRVLCRDVGERWKNGVITSLEPIKVHADGYRYPRTWGEVRQAAVVQDDKKSVRLMRVERAPELVFEAVEKEPDRTTSKNDEEQANTHISSLKEKIRKLQLEMADKKADEALQQEANKQVEEVASSASPDDNDEMSKLDQKLSQKLKAAAKDPDSSSTNEKEQAAEKDPDSSSTNEKEQAAVKDPDSSSTNQKEQAAATAKDPDADINENEQAAAKDPNADSTHEKEQAAAKDPDADSTNEKEQAAAKDTDTDSTNEKEQAAAKQPDKISSNEKEQVATKGSDADSTNKQEQDDDHISSLKEKIRKLQVEMADKKAEEALHQEASEQKQKEASSASRDQSEEMSKLDAQLSPKAKADLRISSIKAKIEQLEREKVDKMDISQKSKAAEGVSSEERSTAQVSAEAQIAQADAVESGIGRAASDSGVGADDDMSDVSIVSEAGKGSSVKACAENARNDCWDHNSGCQGSLVIRGLGVKGRSVGLGATLIAGVALQLQFARHFCLAPSIDFDKINAATYYEASHGSNPWEYYFKPVHMNADQTSLPTCEMSYHELVQLGKNSMNLNEPGKVSELRHLVKRFFQIKDDLRESLDNEWLKLVAHVPHQFGTLPKVLGLHLTANDNYNTTSQEVLPKVQEWLKSHPYSVVFIATEDPGWVKLVQSKWPDDVKSWVRFRDDMQKDGSDRILKQGPFSEGLAALADIALLGKCEKIVHAAPEFRWAAKLFASNSEAADHTDDWAPSVGQTLDKLQPTGAYGHGLDDARCPRVHSLDLAKFRKTAFDSLASTSSVPVQAEPVWHSLSHETA